MMTTKTQGLEAKFLAAQAQIELLHKGGVVNARTANGKTINYGYTRAVDIVLPIQETCQKHGLSLSLSVVDAEVQPGQATIAMEAQLVDPETGETKTAKAIGYAEAKDDKAVYKAQTGAQKYALRLMFNLASEDDPERDSEQRQRQRHADATRPATNRGHRPSTPQAEAQPAVEAGAIISFEQLNKLRALAYNKGGYTKEGAIAMVRDSGYRKASEIQQQNYDDICRKAANPEAAEHYNNLAAHQGNGHRELAEVSG